MNKHNVACATLRHIGYDPDQQHTAQARLHEHMKQAKAEGWDDVAGRIFFDEERQLWGFEVASVKQNTLERDKPSEF